MNVKVTWVDAGIEPKVAPNPDYPDGIDLDVSVAGQPSCKVDLPYPAKRVGAYMLECDVCGLNVGISTAGRPDDPRSIKLSCKRKSDA